MSRSLTLLAGLALSLSLATSVQGQNLLINPDFVDWADDSTPAQTRPTDWVPEGRTYAGLFREDGQVRSGPSAARLERRVDSTGSNNGVRQDSVSVVGGEVYTISAWLKVDTVPDGTVRYTSGRVLVTWRDAAGSTIRSTNPSYVTASDWTLQSYTDTAPANAAMASFMIRCYGRGNPRSLRGGIIYTDDASLVRGAAVTEGESGRPGDYRLAVAPNPFRTGTVIRLATGSQAVTALRLYDATGQVIRTLSEAPGRAREFQWDGRDDAGRELPGGVYFAALQTVSGTNPVHKLLLMR